MRKIYLLLLLILTVTSATTYAQQVPNAGFEDWSGAAFNGNIQPASWNVSNVTQFGFKFNFAHKEAGHTGSASMMVQDQEIGAAGITEVSPGYFSLGQPWVYIKNLTSVDQATAGTEGGITWNYRPDTMSVWIKRTGNNVAMEDFYLLYYAWTGTAKGTKYKGKNGTCTAVSKTDEESDIRQALDGNECGTDQQANQVAEGLWREKKEYAQWTNIRVPIYYFNSDLPTKMNIIFSASNYPNFRANSGLYAGNSLFVDDVELIYSSHIQKLYIDGKEWRGFNPNTSEVQTYSLGRTATTIPTIKAIRGAGSLTNAAGTTISLPGRELKGEEISIQNGTIDGTPTTITVTSEDKKSKTVYQIKFVREASNNAKLADIQINGNSIANYGVTYNPSVFAYTVQLPYGTTTVPVVSAISQEDEQTISITQPTSVTGTATIKVIAADKSSTATYTIQFAVAELADNTLKDILVNGKSVLGFMPHRTSYSVSLPTTTTTMPTVKAVSAYPDGAQSIKYIAPTNIDKGVYQIQVTAPGNPVTKTYKLTFKLEASSYSYLKNLQVGDNLIPNFDPEQLTYYVNLPIGTTALPKIVYEKGEDTQTVEIQEGGLDGTTKVKVTAGNGVSVTEYKLVFSTEKSEISTLKMIYIGGTPLADFTPDKTSYQYDLPIGTTDLPEITVDKGDDYQTVNVVKGGVSGTTRITVTAGNGNTTQYQITFRLLQATNATLKAIYIDGKLIEGYNPEVLEYNYVLPQGTTQLPVVTYEQNDEYQTVTTRSNGVNGDYKITVRPQSGAALTYIIHFSVETSANTNLAMIYLDGVPMENFDPNTTDYEIVLPMGVSLLPTVTFKKAEQTQKVLNVRNGNTQTIIVTAESGANKTYTIQFVLQRSESAYLEMIYLDNTPLENFEKEKLNYTISLSHSTCPKITVDKTEGQQVTITAPYGLGRAMIAVKPDVQATAVNTYTIDFINVKNNQALLRQIYIGSIPLTDFNPEKFSYTITYAGSLPSITYDVAEGQEVTPFGSQDKMILYVIAGEDKAQYEIIFNKQVSDDATLKAILANGVTIPSFESQKKNYTIHVPAGSDIPKITYQKQNERQVVYAGPENDTTYKLLVMADNGDTANYQLHFAIAQYDNANLLNLTVEGHHIDFVPTQYTYHIDLPEGVELPTLHITADIGQTTEIHNVNNQEQQVWVRAENGNQQIYHILYTRITSSIAGLSDILVNGKSLKNFDPNVYNYIDTLEWRTRVVPCVQPIGMVNNQTITTYHSAINATTKIHVQAADGTTTCDYQIAFPVRKSDNTALKDIIVEHDSIHWVFDPQQTDYVIHLPYGEDSVPLIAYEAAEVEQQIQYISRPFGQTTQIIVTAENGDTRTYSLTFLPTYATEQNLLHNLTVMETGQLLSPTDTVATVVLPYGTKTMTVTFDKAFNEQTVWVQPGGIYHPTFITVKSNRPNEQDVVYKLTPQVETQNPAVLEQISIDGTPIADFDKNQFTYIVNYSTSTDMPTVEYIKQDGVQFKRIVNNQWMWQAMISKSGYSNTYTIYFHYPNDIIPNSDFTEWTKAKYNNGDKPVSWQVPADFFESVCVFSCSETGSEIVKSSDTQVGFKTKYWSAAGGALPAVITLGKLSGAISVKNETHYDFAGYINFHNTPDAISVNYQYKSKAGNGALFAYRFQDYDDTEYNFDYTQTATSGQYSTYTQPLDLSGKHIKGMNIAVDATNESRGASSGAELYVDWFKFSYNSTLTSLKVNGIDATLSDTAFSVTLTDPEEIQTPALAFTGQVVDQAQKITWQAESRNGNYGVRKADIVNYAEDGTSTHYTLEVLRPLETRIVLKGLHINGTAFAEFDPNKEDYTIKLSSAQQLPTIYPYPISSLQEISTTYSDSTFSITVTSEKGESKTYSIHFTTELSDDVQLSAISATGINFIPEQLVYDVTAEEMPAITFIKNSDKQTVSLIDGVLHVTAESGATGTYQIRWHKPTITTEALLSTLEINGVEIQNFNSTTYDYIQPRPTTVAFERLAPQDSVIFIQSPLGMTWKVYGTANTHTYTLTYPVEKSNSTDLSAILINGDTIQGFNARIKEYYYTTNDNVHIHAFANNTATNLDMQHELLDNGEVYLYTVTAENGTVGMPYRVYIQPQRSSTPNLQNIYINGVSIDGFFPDQYEYVYTIPTGTYKTLEPVMPSITYDLSMPKQSATLEYGRLGESSNIMVTSEDATDRAVYKVLIQAEPSHNALLTGIAVNGVPVQRFSSRRVYYFEKVTDTNIQLSWASDDHYQTVTQTQEDNIYTLTVTAQDGVTTEEYIVEIYHQPASDDATLAEILLDEQSMATFEPTLNTSLMFSPMQQMYFINLPSGTQTTPAVSAKLKMDGQTIAIRNEAWDTYLDVTAPNGVQKNTYTLHFLTPKSKDANLKMIYLNGDSLTDFLPDRYIYTIPLSIGETTLPEVYAEKGEIHQTIKDSLTGELQRTIFVTAEDGTKNQYVLMFMPTLSAVDTLSAIYADGIPLEGFRTDSFFYAYTLPVGGHFPSITWDEGDKWQQIDTTMLSQSAWQRTTQIRVTAMAGNKNVYTVLYDILSSDIDTLQMIYFKGQPLSDFTGTQSDYYITMEPGDSVAPVSADIIWTQGDEYQTVLNSEVVPYIFSGQQIGWQQTLTVTAQNGRTRLYTIYFVFTKKLSQNTYLHNIYIAGEPLPAFSAEQRVYIHSLLDSVKRPTVLYEKAENSQKVEMTISGDTTILTVTAEDTTCYDHYRIIFTYIKSPNAFIDAIYCDGELLEGFRQDSFEYNILLPYGTMQMPTITWSPNHYEMGIEERKVTSDTTITTLQDGRTATVLHLNVLAPDEENSLDYTVSIHTALSNNCQLRDLRVKDSTIYLFHPDTLVYTLYYEIGTDTTELATVNDVQAITDDPNAQVSIFANGVQIVIQVNAPDGETARTYSIQQVIRQSGNARLANILIDDVPLLGFNPDILEYTYYVTTPPKIQAIPEDSTVQVSDSGYELGQPFNIFVDAPDGSERVYTIIFEESAINTARTPLPTDVLVKHLDGTQVAFATLRKNVSVGIYSAQSNLLFYAKVPECSQNDATIIIDEKGQEKLVDIYRYNVTYTLPQPDIPYIYVFFENDKRKIKSGIILRTK